MELTREQFMEKVNSLNEKTTFNVESTDTGSIYLSLSGCKINVTLGNGICGEIVIFKPYTEMEVTIDFDLVDEIKEDENGTIRLELNNDLADIVIRPVG